MPSKLLFALLSLTLLSAAGCRAGDDAGRATNAPRQQVASQPTAATNAPASNVSAATTPATAAPVAPPAGNGSADAYACRLLTSEEIRDVQGEGVKATKGSDATNGALAVSQCFYETASFANSVSLSLTRSNGDARGEGPREFWNKNFGGEREKGEPEKERREGGEESEGLPPTRVRGVGDDAYWVGNEKIGTLYVLKGDKFLRVSVGGADAQEKKIEKSKTLARRALKRI